jgi:epoxyqueuosine reductase
MNAIELKTDLKAEAERLGFSLFGVAPATEADGFDRFEAWLTEGHHGDMAYLERRRDARRHPAAILPTVRRVVMLGYEYPHSRPEAAPNRGRVAAYARGPDYHDLLWEKLNALGQTLRDRVPESESRGVTDSAPLLERDFARRAGLGWFGKNTMLIDKHRGSFFLLAALLTNLELPADEPHVASHCGTCTACLDACPTGAFPAPGKLDARKCISYLTIETKTAFPLSLREPVGDWLFGCDICQEVCPWNRHAASRSTPFPAKERLASLDAIELLDLSESAFRERFRSTPLARPKWNGLRRNAAIVLGNGGDARALPALERALGDPDATIRDAAGWAKFQILGRLTQVQS